MIFALMFSLVTSFGFVFGSWCCGITDPNDLAVVWIWSYGIPVTILWIVGVASDPKSYNPFPFPQCDAGMWSAFMVCYSIGVPVTVLIMNMKLPSDAYGWWQLATLGLSLAAVTGVVIVGSRMLGSARCLISSN